MPDFLHLNSSVISAFLKQVKLSKLTMHDPGHSSRGSGGEAVVGTGVVVVGRRVVGRGRGVAGTRVLSQQTEPLLQVEVLWRTTKMTQKF